MAPPELGKTAVGFGPASEPLFGWYHEPGGAARRGWGVVVCNPIGDDLTRAHRPLRHLAERLARAGFPVLRFDWRGTGDSAGDERGPARVAAWLEDVGAAIAELRARAGVSQVCLVGGKLGGTLAAAAAARRDDVAALVLWDAYASGAAFLADALRTHKLHRRIEPHGFTGGPPEPGGEEALGFFISAEPARDLAGVDLARLGGRPAPEALVLDDVPGASDAVAVHLGAAGVAVARRALPLEKFWVVPPQHGPLPEGPLAAACAWLVERAPAAVTGDPPRDVPGAADVAGDEPVVFGGARPLFGMLRRAAEPRPGRPAIVLLNAGCAHRIGPHRMYVPIARRLAALGFTVLRLDVSGVGDSPVAPGAPEDVTYPPGAMRDVEAAVTFLRESAGCERVVLIGLCSGADIAFQAAYGQPGVAGLVMINPRTFLMLDLAQVDAYHRGHYYQRAVGRQDAWKKLLRGQVDLVRVARTVGPRVVGAALMGARRIVTRVGLGGAPADDVPTRLRRIAERGIDTFLLVSAPDPGVDFVDARHGRAMAALRALPGFRREDLAGTDHTFTAIFAQRRVADLLAEHLAARWLHAREEAA